MTAEEMVLALQKPTTPANCPLWVRETALLLRPNRRNKLYSTTSVLFYREVTVRIPAIKTAKRSGKQYRGLQRRHIDMAALIRPHYRVWQPFIVGMEIKVDKNDLLNDDKMAAYLPYCHAFFLAVPSALKETANHHLYDYQGPLLNVGLLLVDDDHTVRRCHEPRLSKPDGQHLKDIFIELWSKPRKQRGDDADAA